MKNDILDVNKIRKEFPFFAQSNLAYLDNSATTQKPMCVMKAEQEFYEKYNANPFRGIYELSELATEKYEQAREVVRDFVNASSEKEIIFTRNATEGLNLAAFSLSELLLNPEDEILIGIEEHHSNLIPWQQAAKRTGAVLKFLECDADGFISEERFREAMTDRVKIVAITHMSNIFGRINDVKTFAGICHENGAVIVVDGAQSVPHIPVDVQKLDIDFLAFSGHKMMAPMSIGVLYGRKNLLEKMPPFLTGGEMIETVTRDGATYAQLPHKFEAGTVNAGGAVALAEAIHYINKIGFEKMQKREEMMTELAFEKISQIKGVHVIGSENPKEHHGILTFTVDQVHPHDVAAILAEDLVAVRAGHHCAQPLHQFLKVPSTTRASIYFYNTEEEIERFADSLSQVRRKMGFVE